MDGIVSLKTSEGDYREPMFEETELSTIPFVASLEAAELLAARECWRIPSRRSDDHLEAWSLPWFLQIERRRYARHGYWLPKMLELTKHRNDHILCFADGLGTDAVRYAENGAEVTLCSDSQRQLHILQRHFNLRAVRGKLIESKNYQIPLATHSIDMVYLGETALVAGLPVMIQEIYRVLKPGGKLLGIFPALYNAGYWKDHLIPWEYWFRPRNQIAIPLYSARQLRLLFHPFVEQRIFKRHLRRSDLPHLWRIFPLQILERLMGRFMIIKALKPISAVNSLQAQLIQK